MNVIVKPWWGLETCCDSRSEEMGLSAVIAISALFGFWTWRKQRRTGYRGVVLRSLEEGRWNAPTPDRASCPPRQGSFRSA
jgi:hypothetical protein